MPTIRLNKTFGVGRGIKVFFDLFGGATRGEVPETEQQRKLRTALQKQRRLLRKRDQQIKRGRRRVVNKRKTLKQQRVEIFRLTNELRTMSDLAVAASSAPVSRNGMEVGTLPDFVIIGAQKCGTTHLFDLLSRHPNFEPGALKEAHYFDRSENLEKGVEWYRRLFLKPTWEDGQRSITGEKTPSYLFDPAVPERMARVLPDAKLMALLRNPVDRAYSHYHHLARSGREKRGFKAAIDAEQAWLAGHDGPAGSQVPASGSGSQPGLLSRGIYVDQLVRWHEFFDAEQLLVLKGEDFFKHTTEMLEEIQDFLGLPRHEIKVRSRNAKVRYEPMDFAIRERLEAFFEPHNRRLYEYLGRNFGW